MSYTVLWKRRQRTDADGNIECPRDRLDALEQIFAVARVGAVRRRPAYGRAMTTLNVVLALFRGSIALWKGGVIRYGVGGGVNISIEYAFRNLDKAQFLEALFKVADIWYYSMAFDCDNNEGKRGGHE